MSFLNIPIFNDMKARLNYLSERQAVLAQNIANADTPGYKAKDVSEPDFQKTLAQQNNSARQLHMAITNSKDLTPPPDTAAFKVTQRPGTDELNPNGNNVSIEDEMQKVATNQAEYTRTLNLYHKMVTMFNTAIGAPTS